jgi:hypothetical protein
MTVLFDVDKPLIYAYEDKIVELLRELEKEIRNKYKE